MDQREDAAEDVAQATLCQAVRRLDSWRGEASLFTWICAICRHEIDGWRRIHGKQTPVPLVEDAPEVRAALESFYVKDGPARVDRRLDAPRRSQPSTSEGESSRDARTVLGGLELEAGG